MSASLRQLLVPTVLAVLGACTPRGAMRPSAAPAPSSSGARGKTAVASRRPDARRGGNGLPSLSTAAAYGGAVAEADLGYLRRRELMVPVAGIRPERVPDSFDEARGGSRRHNAVDILAPRGTPVLAADSGRVLKLRTNAAGGITVYAVDPSERFVYYYAHLDHYRDGLAEGAVLAKGDVIGYVGTTGNAPPDTPHLHFQVMLMSADRRYWDGVPVDPKPFLALDGREP
ncbi:MAG TPA: M23 family metallopeptidase [Gemmatimonadaceae bacterium]|nr:M23 family metallopeptidase [Gemmatimonadaceae bacterium]